MPVITVPGGHYPPLTEWALGSGESVVSFPRFITELLTFPPRLARAADFLWSVFSTVQRCGSGGLFDDLVGADDQCGRDFKAEGFGSLEINDKLDVGRKFDWQIAGFGAL
jgi:hypothetical protein